MKIRTLKGYQERAVTSGLAALSFAQGEYQRLRSTDKAGIRQITAHAGCLLLEAPTGSGKTLIAAHVLEEFSQRENIAWFWFAPFKGVTGQTTSFLREQCAGLRVRDLGSDRQITGSRSGDVFITTWQAVAVKAREQRNARMDSDLSPGVDTLVTGLRQMGFRIGVVVDEAHHSFRGQSQAAAFYRDVLEPEYTVLITATPDDKELAKWKTHCGIKDVRRISVSRLDAVEAGLVKAGVRCISFVPDGQSQGLVDMEMTCLRSAAGIHDELKARLADAKISLTPLLLVQVDSRKKDSVEQAKERLLMCGFAEEQIAVHTADEPDAGLLGLANNERVEVLIFKMAVALGFDAPRAFTLVSMRAVKDEDFGVQLIGRILRVHRRLQSKSVPEALQYGYVLLADPDSQAGLQAAGEKMRAVQTEMVKIAPTVAVVCVAGANQVQILGPGGQTTLFPNERVEKEALASSDGSGQRGFEWDSEGFQLEGQQGVMPPSRGVTPGVQPIVGLLTGRASASTPLAPSRRRYPLRSDVPRNFKTVMLPESVEHLEGDCARHFMVDAAAILSAMVTTVQVQKRTLEVFTGQLLLDYQQADLSSGEIARRAQGILLENDHFDAKALREVLLTRLNNALKSQGLGHMCHPLKVAELLNAMLLTKPGLLADAQRKAIAEHATVENAAPLPEALEFEFPVVQSTKNIYRLHPPDMNGWEQAFAQSLDAEQEQMVRWWHRNEPRKPHSVSLVLPTGKRFFPDFVISVVGRRKEHGILLADPKAMWEESRQHDKVLAEHPTYGRALILYKTGEFGWQRIVWDQKHHKPTLGTEWTWEDAATW